MPTVDSWQSVYWFVTVLCAGGCVLTAAPHLMSSHLNVSGVLRRTVLGIEIGRPIFRVQDSLHVANGIPTLVESVDTRSCWQGVLHITDTH